MKQILLKVFCLLASTSLLAMAEGVTKFDDLLPENKIEIVLQLKGTNIIDTWGNVSAFCNTCKQQRALLSNQQYNKYILKGLIATIKPGLLVDSDFALAHIARQLALPIVPFDYIHLSKYVKPSRLSYPAGLKLALELGINPNDGDLVQDGINHSRSLLLALNGINRTKKLYLEHQDYILQNNIFKELPAASIMVQNGGIKSIEYFCIAARLLLQAGAKIRKEEIPSKFSSIEDWINSDLEKCELSDLIQ